MLTMLRWAARVASLAVVVGIVLLWIHAPPRLPDLPIALRWRLAALVVGVLGLLTGFWRERLGGILALLGFGGFLVLEGLHIRSFPNVPAVYAMMLPALLFLIVGPRRRPATA